MSRDQLTTELQSLIQRVRDVALDIRVCDPTDLVVVGCKPDDKPALSDIVALANRVGLRVKWLNEGGTLVAIGLPTLHGPKEKNQTARGRAPVLRGGGTEGREENRPDEGA